MKINRLIGTNNFYPVIDTDSSFTRNIQLLGEIFFDEFISMEVHCFLSKDKSLIGFFEYEGRHLLFCQVGDQESIFYDNSRQAEIVLSVISSIRELFDVSNINIFNNFGNESFINLLINELDPSIYIVNFSAQKLICKNCFDIFQKIIKLVPNSFIAISSQSKQTTSKNVVMNPSYSKRISTNKIIFI